MNSSQFLKLITSTSTPNFTIPVKVTPKLVEQVVAVAAYALCGLVVVEIIKSVNK